MGCIEPLAAPDLLSRNQGRHLLGSTRCKPARFCVRELLSPISTNQRSSWSRHISRCEARRSRPCRNSWSLVDRDDHALRPPEPGGSPRGRGASRQARGQKVGQRRVERPVEPAKCLEVIEEGKVEAPGIEPGSENLCCQVLRAYSVIESHLTGCPPTGHPQGQLLLVSTCLQ